MPRQGTTYLPDGDGTSILESPAVGDTSVTTSTATATTYASEIADVTRQLKNLGYAYTTDGTFCGLPTLDAYHIREDGSATYIGIIAESPKHISRTIYHLKVASLIPDRNAGQVCGFVESGGDSAPFIDCDTADEIVRAAELLSQAPTYDAGQVVADRLVAQA